MANIKRVFIIHGWSDTPNNGWFPWLKKKLVADGVEVHVPSMPDADHPLIETWVSFLKHLIGQADEQTYVVGHSVGCQAILRYLETLPAGTNVGGVVLVAPWMNLKAAALEDEDVLAVALPWMQRPVNWPKIRSHLNQAVCIMSDDDQFVPLADKEIFEHELGATIVIEHHKRHLGGEDGVTALASVAMALEGMMGPQRE